MDRRHGFACWESITFNFVTAARLCEETDIENLFIILC